MNPEYHVVAAAGRGDPYLPWYVGSSTNSYGQLFIAFFFALGIALPATNFDRNVPQLGERPVPAPTGFVGALLLEKRAQLQLALDDSRAAHLPAEVIAEAQAALDDIKNLDDPAAST